MSKLEDPEVKVKLAMVVTTYPGASAHQVELEVTDLLEKQIRALEREIEKQEQRSAELDGQIEAAASDYQELARLMEEKQTCDDTLTGLMDEWERLSSELEDAT